jgi:hypothetical protein
MSAEAEQVRHLAGKRLSRGHPMHLEGNLAEGKDLMAEVIRNPCLEDWVYDLRISWQRLLEILVLRTVFRI